MIKLDNITVSYGAVEALSQLDLTVKEGSILAVMGRNGVGKTTLMKTIVGLLKSDTGNIHYREEDVTSLPAYKRVTRGIGYVPQGRWIFPRLSVEENLRTGLRNPKSERNRDIFDEVYEYFPVLKEMKNRSGGDLSGGQQQQLSIGRALMSEPELLILDEPTEGIQPNIIERIGEVLNRLANDKSMTIIIVEQYLDFIKEFSSDFIIINRGHIVEQGLTLGLSEQMIEKYLHV